MELNTQIILLIFSFIYGFLFSIVLSFNYKFTYKLKNIYKIIFSFMITMSSLLIYLIFLKHINNIIIHPYSILMIILGFILECFIATKMKR